MRTDPRGRWRQQYQRITDVVTQRCMALDEAEAVERYGSLKMRDHIKALVDTAPPLSPAQRDRLAMLLRPSGGTR